MIIISPQLYNNSSNITLFVGQFFVCIYSSDEDNSIEDALFQNQFLKTTSPIKRFVCVVVVGMYILYICVCGHVYDVCTLTC